MTLKFLINIISIVNGMFGAIAGLIYGIAIYISVYSITSYIIGVNVFHNDSIVKLIGDVFFSILVIASIIYFSAWYYQGFRCLLERKGIFTKTA